MKANLKVTKKICNAIAIDGPAGCGKSTVARMVATKLGMNYVNTGQMYRAIAYFAIQENLLKLDCKKMLGKFANEKIIFKNQNTVLWKGKNIAKDLQEESVSNTTPLIAQNFFVREFCVLEQQKIAQNSSVVMEGRDTTTKVLPNAIVKIFMFASAEIRAKRRLKQNLSWGIESDYKTILAEIKNRDAKDLNRVFSPLRVAKNAIKINTDHLSQNQVTEKIISVYNGRKKHGV